MDCPRCKSFEFTKAGFVNGRQRYKCRQCHYLYTVLEKATSKPVALKRYALHLYLEGLSFRAIGKILGVSNVTVLKWIKEFGDQVENIRREQHIDVVEMNQLYSYIGRKQAVDEHGLLVIGMNKHSSPSCWVTGGRFIGMK